MMCNKEGYRDSTAEIAISRVYKEEMTKKKGGEKNGDKRLTYSKESTKVRQHKA